MMTSTTKVRGSFKNRVEGVKAKEANLRLVPDRNIVLHEGKTYKKVPWDLIHDGATVMLGFESPSKRQFNLYGPYTVVNAATRTVKNPWLCKFACWGEHAYVRA